MDTLKSAARLALFAVLSIAVMSLGEDVPGVTPGALDFTLSEVEVSSLSINPEALLETLCGGSLDPGSIGSGGECRLKVTNTAGGGQQRGIRGIASRIDPTAPVPLISWRPTDLGLSGAEPVVTSCGVWDVSLDLDPSQSQPDSAILLRPTGRDSEKGLSAGVLALNVRLSFSNRTTGQELDYPLTLGLGLAASWSLAPAPPGTASRSNLRLLDDGEIHCLPIELLVIPEILEMFERGDCQLCIEAVRSSG